MSYMRCGWPLKYFKGETKSYVFVGSYPTKEGVKKYKAGKRLTKKDYEEHVCDYNDKYKDNASFCELIGNIVLRETDDEEYAYKIIKVLAKKLRVEHKLRKKPLTWDQYSKEMGRMMRKFNKENQKLVNLLSSGKKS